MSKTSTIWLLVAFVAVVGLSFVQTNRINTLQSQVDALQTSASANLSNRLGSGTATVMNGGFSCSAPGGLWPGDACTCGSNNGTVQPGVPRTCSGGATAYNGSGTVGNSNQTTLSIGSTGRQVSELQTMLISQKYLTGKETGTFDSNTAKALSAYQTKNKLTVTGKFDNATRAQVQASIIYNSTHTAQMPYGAGCPNYNVGGQAKVGDSCNCGGGATGSVHNNGWELVCTMTSTASVGGTNNSTK